MASSVGQVLAQYSQNLGLNLQDHADPVWWCTPLIPAEEVEAGGSEIQSHLASHHIFSQPSLHETLSPKQNNIKSRLRTYTHTA